jgi:hypothetical protein
MARHTTLEERLQIIEWKQYGLPTAQIVQTDRLAAIDHTQMAGQGSISCELLG